MTRARDTYKLFASLYDTYINTFDDDLNFYRQYCIPGDNIIEIGCGTGRILKFLLENDCTVTGIDISMEMLGKADEKLKNWIQNGRLQIFRHDLSENFLSHSYSCALITFYTMNYIMSPEIFLKNIHKSLNNNGLLLIDLFYPNTMFNKSIENKWLTKHCSINGQNISIKDKRRMRGHIEERHQIFTINNSDTEIHSERRYYNPEKMKQLLINAGFCNIKQAVGYDYNSFSDSISESELKTNYIIKAEKID